MTTKTGRNQPCPCGSGKKFKQCCLRKEEEAEHKAMVDRHTVARWREWWCTTFVQTRFWQAKQAAFAPPVDQSRLPASMFERVLGRPLRQLVNLLRFLTPITGGAPAVRVS